MEYHEDQEHREHDQEIDTYELTCRPKMSSPVTTASSDQSPPPLSATSPPAARNPRYRECLKNHAVGLGGHAVDGCLEFLAAGPDGTIDALKCAACNCHRNFHRKESSDMMHPPLTYHHHHQNLLLGPPPTYYRSTPSGYLHLSPRPLALPSTSGGGGASENEDASDPVNGGGFSNKRHRTKFTAEQKDKMLNFAEKLEWRIQKNDEEAVQQFCHETGVKRHVLKVWMHNNKHTLGKKLSYENLNN